MENAPFEEVFPIENGDFPACYVWLPEEISQLYKGWVQPESVAIPGSISRGIFRSVPT